MLIHRIWLKGTAAQLVSMRREPQVHRTKILAMNRVECRISWTARRGLVNILSAELEKQIFVAKSLLSYCEFLDRPFATKMSYAFLSRTRQTNLRNSLVLSISSYKQICYCWAGLSKRILDIIRRLVGTNADVMTNWNCLPTRWMHNAMCKRDNNAIAMWLRNQEKSNSSSVSLQRCNMIKIQFCKRNIRIRLQRYRMLSC